MLKVDDVPTSAQCQVNGRTVEMALDLATGLEFLVAYELQGKVGGANQQGYDVYDSALYSGLTFQVKYSSVQKPSSQRGTSFFLWQERHRRQRIIVADYYVLFGIKNDMFFPFLVPFVVWKRRLTTSGKTGHFYISGRRFSRKGGKQNLMWNHYILDWPEGLHRRLNAYQQLDFKEMI